MLKKWVQIIIIKWVFGQCHHLCCLCEYRNQCEEDYDNDLIQSFKDYKKYRQVRKEKNEQKESKSVNR